MSGNLKKYELVVECTSIEGNQTFACYAENAGDARRKFRSGECQIIDEQLEVIGLDSEIEQIYESDDISSRLPSDVISSLEKEIQTLKENRAKALEVIEAAIRMADDCGSETTAEAIRVLVERLHDGNLMGNAYYCECDNCGNCYQVVIPETTCENCGEGTMQPQDVEPWGDADE